ncbi:hypothetical protein BaRGS_00012705, partial [Batillaria attramentaria]
NLWTHTAHPMSSVLAEVGNGWPRVQGVECSGFEKPNIGVYVTAACDRPGHPNCDLDLADDMADLVVGASRSVILGSTLNNDVFHLDLLQPQL